MAGTPGAGGGTATLPLSGRRVAVTRARAQAGALARLLVEAGAEVVEVPAIEVQPLPETPVLDAALGELGRWDLLVLTSPNGVEALGARLQALGIGVEALAGIPLAAVGPATASACRALGLEPRHVPSRSRAEALVEELPEEAVRGRRVLVVRALEGREVLPEGLAARGARVTLAPAYRVAAPEGAAEEARALLSPGVDAVAFASGSAVRHLLEALGGGPEGLGAARVATIGPVTTDACRGLGVDVHAEAPRATLPDLVEAVIAALRGDEQ
ncbi:uroporphyrinogen-III synthase [Myxococcota bacterium]|nr:uroporphyrinogen-III synthase [Myxococcota bacterium]